MALLTVVRDILLISAMRLIRMQAVRSDAFIQLERIQYTLKALEDRCVWNSSAGILIYIVFTPIYCILCLKNFYFSSVKGQSVLKSFSSKGTGG